MSSDGIVKSVCGSISGYVLLAGADGVGSEGALIGGGSGRRDASKEADSDMANRKLTQTYLIYRGLTYIPVYPTLALAVG